MSVRDSLVKVRDNVWELPSSYKKERRVPGRLYLDDEAKKDMDAAKSKHKDAIKEYNAIDKEINSTEDEINFIEQELVQAEKDLELKEKEMVSEIQLQKV